MEISKLSGCVNFERNAFLTTMFLHRFRVDQFTREAETSPCGDSAVAAWADILVSDGPSLRHPRQANRGGEGSEKKQDKENALTQK
jgi:hypothetical protein